MHRFLLSILLVSLSAGTLAFAADVQRYTLQKTDYGYVRTNVETGETSICTQSGDQLVCRLAADDSRAFETEVSGLRARIASLEKRLSALETANKPDSLSQPLVKNEEDFKNSLDHMEQFFRRFMGIVKEFQFLGEKTNPQPDHT